MSLTERELEVLAALLNGWSEQFIAEALHVSVNTVNTYKRSIYQYLGVRSKKQLEPLRVMAHGFVVPEKKQGAGT